MAKSPVYGAVTLERYLAFEETSPEKHELFRGHVYAMAGGGASHGEIIDSLAQACGSALRGKPCRFVSDNRKVAVNDAGSGYYPDGAIACPPNYVDRKRGVYDNPTVVFEVLSPGTERSDRNGKFDDYKTLPSLQDYVLIESEVVRVELFSRLDDGRWAQSVVVAGSMSHSLYRDRTPPRRTVRERRLRRRTSFAARSVVDSGFPSIGSSCPALVSENRGCSPRSRRWSRPSESPWAATGRWTTTRQPGRAIKEGRARGPCPALRRRASGACLGGSRWARHRADRASQGREPLKRLDGGYQSQPSPKH